MFLPRTLMRVLMVCVFTTVFTFNAFADEQDEDTAKALGASCAALVNGTVKVSALVRAQALIPEHLWSVQRNLVPNFAGLQIQALFLKLPEVTPPELFSQMERSLGSPWSGRFEGVLNPLNNNVRENLTKLRDVRQLL